MPPAIPFDDLRRNLAFRNLTRATMVKLASGQQMVDTPGHPGRQGHAADQGADHRRQRRRQADHLTDAARRTRGTRTPLWFYVLREAEPDDGRLRGVGARIVAETFHRAMEGSRFSIIRDPGFRPDPGRDDTTFEMTDLLFFAFAGKKAEINPLGGA